MTRIQEFIDCFDNLEEAAMYLRNNADIDINSFHNLDHTLKHCGPFSLFKPKNKADMSNPMVREANCLILDENNELLAKAWDHPVMFDNPDERFPESFSFGANTIATELPDGEIVVIYNVDGNWVIGTADHPTGENYINGIDLPAFTYSHEIKALLFRRYNTSWKAPFKNTNPMMCFIFSYVSPHLGRIMPILIPELYLMGVTNLENGHDLSSLVVDGLANKMDFARPNWSEINGRTSLANRLQKIRALSPGLMLEDENCERLVITNPIYKAVANAKSAGARIRSTHIANILQACRDRADVTTVIASYDNFRPMLSLLERVRKDLWEELIILWNSVKDEKNIRNFAEAVQHHPLNYMLFKYRDGAITNLQNEVNKIKPTKLASLAHRKYPEEFEGAANLLKSSGGNTNAVEEESDQEEEGSIPFCQDGD